MNVNDLMARLRIDDLRREAEAERVARRMLAGRRGEGCRRTRSSPEGRAAGLLRSAGAWLISWVATRRSAILEREGR
jgi:hypothetical protein